MPSFASFCVHITFQPEHVSTPLHRPGLARQIRSISTFLASLARAVRLHGRCTTGTWLKRLIREPNNSKLHPLSLANEDAVNQTAQNVFTFQHGRLIPLAPHESFPCAAPPPAEQATGLEMVGFRFADTREWAGWCAFGPFQAVPTSVRLEEPDPLQSPPLQLGHCHVGPTRAGPTCSDSTARRPTTAEPRPLT